MTDLQLTPLVFEKLKFVARRGLRRYQRDGRRFFEDMASYLDRASREGRSVGEVRVDARTDDWQSEHPLRKSVLEASYTADQVRRFDPATVCDVGSDQVFIGTLSSFVEVVVVDTRAMGLDKPGLTFKKADARGLPFTDGECEFMSSLCVVEHIGLGRYGDSIDPQGDYKFVAELRRCLAPGGKLVLSFPVGERPALVFNAHRVYGLNEIPQLTAGLSIVDEKFIKPRHGLLDRSAALADIKGRSQDYLIWIGCLENTSTKGEQLR